MLRGTECCGLLNHRGLFRVGLVYWGFLHRTSEKGAKNGHGIRFLLCSPMLFGVSGMLAGVR